MSAITFGIASSSWKRWPCRPSYGARLIAAACTAAAPQDTTAPDSDIDIAAYFGDQPPNSFDVLLPPGADLLVLDGAPLELAGRVATGGRLLFDDDPAARVAGQTTFTAAEKLLGSR
jgi:hypothetical protein